MRLTQLQIKSQDPKIQPMPCFETRISHQPCPEKQQGGTPPILRLSPHSTSNHILMCMRMSSSSYIEGFYALLAQKPVSISDLWGRGIERTLSTRTSSDSCQIISYIVAKTIYLMFAGCFLHMSPVTICRKRTCKIEGHMRLCHPVAFVCNACMSENRIWRKNERKTEWKNSVTKSR